MFVKIFTSILDSWIARDPDLRGMFEDILKLANPEGVVDMTYDAIAARTRKPIELVISKIAELEAQHPESKDQSFGGACITRLDPRRSYGWQIVNYIKYRGIRSETDRKAYKREWMRKHRAKDRGGQIVHSGQLWTKKGEKGREGANGGQLWTPVDNAPDSTREGRGHLWTPVDNGGQLWTQAEAYTEVPPSVPLPGGQSQLDFGQAKEFFNALFGRTKRKWSAEEEQLLFEITPIDRVDAALLVMWFKLPADHPVWLVTKRKQQLTTLLRDFNGELDKIKKYAPEYGLSGRLDRALAVKKEEPSRWREFLNWRYDRPRLPESFWELPNDIQDTYFNGFAKFMEAAK